MVQETGWPGRFSSGMEYAGLTSWPGSIMDCKKQYNEAFYLTSVKHGFSKSEI
jgi:hypothetical protein